MPNSRHPHPPDDVPDRIHTRAEATRPVQFFTGRVHAAGDLENPFLDMFFHFQTSHHPAGDHGGHQPGDEIESLTFQPNSPNNSTKATLFTIGAEMRKTSRLTGHPW